ncbi:GNAT family N-acetyltransferase [Helicobacter muridarum]|uniref:GNAT family N-acetyltransferase n=1 Tax=Helicobacter muridarum TaxID=216 RepID=A0A099TXB3_9HELI|nr:GNAT family N-acetyltransferase [Helicobacter muridarum]TLD98510.1 GNAT family N-acetyltransferase [Helicobacter muridarum]STQ86809.1 GNAT family acetyltransferase [Helicobacter muridarum]
MQELKDTKDLESAYDLMKQLRPHLSQEDFVAKVLEQQKSMHYRLFAFYDKQKLVGLCGVMPFDVLYREKCLYICDLVIDSSLRGQGFGQKFLQEIENLACIEGYLQIELSSNFQRTQAHHFYESKMGFEKPGYVFVKSIGK